MPILPRRFKRIQSVINHRMDDLTVLLEEVEKPHNLSAILRSCDAVGVLEAHAVFREGIPQTFNSTAQGSQKWVKLQTHQSIQEGIESLSKKGFKLYGTNLNENSIDYRQCDFKGPTAFVLGAEKWGLRKKTLDLIDVSIKIPMRGMVQSLNVSVAAAILLYEALRQRDVSGVTPRDGEGLAKELYIKRLFEWSYPEVAEWCNKEGREYPRLNAEGEIIESLPRTIKLPH